jgi:acyl-CoA dehydrogenase
MTELIVQTYGALLAHGPEAFWASVAVFVLGFLALGYVGASLPAFFLLIAGVCYGYGAPLWAAIAIDVVFILLVVPFIRRNLFSAPAMKMLQNAMPPISQTEKTAIEAGTVWVEGELFSGAPDMKRLLAEAYPELSKEEKAFLDGPCEQLCRMTNDWEAHSRKDLSPEVWDFLKKNKFMGMIVPKEYGGLGFSAIANSAVVLKMGSRSVPLAVTAMVPNSLGPAELLAHYGTKEQKDKYLPRLADGREIPCFALTEPTAGSDAASIQARGVVFKDSDGQLKMRVTWDKRYITLGSIATLLGLAFQLEDPNELLGMGKTPGITCALIPTDTPGVDVSERHDPLGVPFINSVTRGKDVVVSVDYIIGGPQGAGNGWRMLMECLSAGRGISLPAMSVGGSKLAVRAVGAYAAVRKQFGLPIGKFEGIEEPLARIGGYCYILEASRRYTCGALDKGAKPAVVSAIAKYYSTELARMIVNDAMDVSGGSGISRGPRNLLASRYIGMPISITVEGANILTRTLMIFGQGAIRSHPYAYKEMAAIQSRDLKAFDAVFWAHAGFVIRNMVRAKLLFLTRGWLASSPVSGPTAKYWRRLSWASANFAFMTDVAMGALAGDLKRKEKLTGRFADILSWMYLGTAVLRRWEAEGRLKEDLPFVQWSMEHAFNEIQKAFDGLYQNLPFMNFVWRGPVAFFHRLNPIGRPPADWLGHKVAHAIQTIGEQRDRMTDGIYLTDDPAEALGGLEMALRLSSESEPVLGKIKQAIREKKLPRARPETLLAEAVEKDIISKKESALVRRAEAARRDAIQVDSFTQEEYMAGAHAAPKSSRISMADDDSYAEDTVPTANGKAKSNGHAAPREESKEEIKTASAAASKAPAKAPQGGKPQQAKQAKGNGAPKAGGKPSGGGKQAGGKKKPAKA